MTEREQAKVTIAHVLCPADDNCRACGSKDGNPISVCISKVDNFLSLSGPGWKLAIVDTHKLAAAIETLGSVLKIGGMATGGEQVGNRECIWDMLQWLKTIR